MKYDCVIIGGGLSGLAAGIRLAHYDKKVVLVERNHNLGGLNTHYRRGGHHIESGLHAMTNFVAKDAPKAAPLLKLARQLRFSHDDFALREQNFSLVKFPSATLKFANGFESLLDSVAACFPSEVDNLRRLDRLISEYDSLSLSAKPDMARAVVGRHLSSPLLVDMLFCPLMYYGSPSPDDMNFAHFAVMFKSVFHEGFCRPAAGIQGLLDMLEARYRQEGGELVLGNGAARILQKGGMVEGVVLDDGMRLETKSVLSCAGRLETLGLLEERAPELDSVRPGAMGFMECVAFLDQPVKGSGHDAAIVFQNGSDSFSFRPPDTLAGMESSVVCCPENFRFAPGDVLPEPCVRVTALANPAGWDALAPEAYRQAKLDTAAMLLVQAEAAIGLPGLQKRASFLDIFTPKTIRRFTGHLNGAVYGSPDKARDGRTSVSNLFLCGTDQGFLGIVGAMLSGVSIANAELLTKI